MSEPWRNGTDDEVEVELSSSSIVLDRVSGEVAIPGMYGLANLTLIDGMVAATLQELTPDDLRRMAAAFIAFADVLDGDPAEPA